MSVKEAIGILNAAISDPRVGLAEGDTGYLLWHDSWHSNLVKVHEMYRRYI